MSRPLSNTATGLAAPPLRPFITHYAGFCISGLPPGTFVGLPSRNITLIISFAEPIEILRMPNQAQRPDAYGALVAGLQDAPAVVRQRPEAHGVHVFLTPLGARSVLGVPSVELASRIVALEDLWGPDAAQLIERLASARTWGERFQILDQVFIAKLAPAQAVPEIAGAWEELTRTHGGLRIGDLAQAVGWSRRHFASRFRDTLGITPKLAARVFRFGARLLAHEAARRARGRGRRVRLLRSGASEPRMARACRLRAPGLDRRSAPISAGLRARRRRSRCLEPGASLGLTLATQPRH